MKWFFVVYLVITDPYSVEELYRVPFDTLKECKLEQKELRESFPNPPWPYASQCEYSSAP